MQTHSNNIFNKEEAALQRAIVHLESNDNKTLKAEFALLIEEYQSMLSQLQKIVSISDNTQRKLMKARQTIQKQNDVIHSDLLKAEDYIKSLLPRPINNELININWFFHPSSELGGDTFGYHNLDEDNLAIYLIDASGHGIGSALYSVSVLNHLKFQTLPGCNFYEPSDVLKILNKTFRMSDHNYLYFTIWYGVLNLKTGLLKYAESGHPPALLFNKDGQISEFSSANYIIGALPEYDYLSSSIKLNPPCSFYVFSDGVYEIMTPDEEMWEYDEFVNFLKVNSKNSGVEMEQLFHHVQTICGKKVLDDDFTIMKFRI